MSESLEEMPMDLFGSTQDFQRWAAGFSGCDGGNPFRSYWFCGIEYGGSSTESNLIFDDVSAPACWTDERRVSIVREPYNRNVLKMLAVIKGLPVSKFKEIGLQPGGAFGKDSDSFRMNLFPISFHQDSDELWEEWLYRKTGLATKSMYRAWCQIYRFPMVAAWVRQYAPRAIVATSRSYETEFLMAFDGNKSVFENKKKLQTIELGNGRILKWLPINGGRTLLFVTPFLGGRYGLNSDQLLASAGKAIAGLVAGPVL